MIAGSRVRVVAVRGTSLHGMTGYVLGERGAEVRVVLDGERHALRFGRHELEEIGSADTVPAPGEAIDDVPGSAIE